ncbi:hypothetical protein PMI16_03553 [Herbaspirillum sp. CF444]|uniref:hypothetical protein n=1 Tax=Herbaspirillum sp. CF444 TaxID=1144319 RepID=UPI000272340F|nr:hypothetical protein [Herbaspirillum sp. CF444]EJL85249.1 hypothetical protein PMI16_03553 [Herbaspirillum sp. CF444]
MSNFDNPAERLLLILRKGKTFSSANPCLAGWKMVLMTNDLSTMLARLGNVMKLPYQVVEMATQTIPTESESWDYWFPKINEGFSTQNLSGQWQTFIGHIDDHTLRYLSMTSRLLNSSSSQKVIEEVELKEIKAKLVAILESLIEQTNIPTSVLSFVHRTLHSLIESIDQYFITGALPISDMTDSALGHALLNPEYRDFLKENSLGKAYIETVIVLAKEIVKATNKDTQIEMGPIDRLIGF